MKAFKIFIFIMIILAGIIEVLAIIKGIDGKLYGVLIGFYSYVIGRYWDILKKKIRIKFI